MITVGTRLRVSDYARIVKNVLNENRHETIELLGFEEQGLSKLTQVVNVLTSWGYATVVKIKTRPDPSLKIIVKRTADFQDKFDAFNAALAARREERRKKAEAERGEKAETKATEEPAPATAAAETATAETAPAEAVKEEEKPADAQI